MYTKLTGRGILILTGLSALLLQTCDPPRIFYSWLQLYSNRSGREVVLVSARPEDGIYRSDTLAPGAQLNELAFAYGGNDSVSEFMRNFEGNPLRTISLYMDKDSLKDKNHTRPCTQN